GHHHVERRGKAHIVLAAAFLGHHRLRAGQHIAAVADEPDPLEDQKRQRGEDDDRQEADGFHAALPPMPGRMASCCSAEWRRPAGSTGWPLALASGCASGSGCTLAAAVMRAIFSISCAPEVSCTRKSSSNCSACSRRSLSRVSASSAAVFSSFTALLARPV